MLPKMLRRLIAVLALTLSFGGLAGPAFAAKGEHPHEHAWSWEGVLGTYDRGAVQRGFAVYKQVCSACHGMRHLSYRNLGERGGPFAAYQSMNHETGEEEIHLGGHGRLVDPNDNPYVRAIANDYQIPTIDTETGLETTRDGRPSDKFRYPYANEIQGRAANGGAYPPDLSVITHARHYGPDYVRSLLLGYTGERKDGKYVNPYMGGGLIAMAPPITDETAAAFTYDDGTVATKEQMAEDVVTFLQWAADPKMELRKQMGLGVMIFLLVLTLLLYAAYKQVWRGVKH
ncbi:MAG: cytochrome c1 [Caulobacterales bacterium]|jgi:ubiquinol-cytochrome c reductase cytochrome c1 subunit